MANQKISAMSAAAALDGTEIVPVVQSDENVRTTTQDIADLAGARAETISAFTSGDATPSVANATHFVTAGSTAITNFDDGVEGQVIEVIWGGSNIVITDNANIDPVISGNLTLTATQPSARFRLASGVWKQIGEAGVLSAAMTPVAQGSLDQAMEQLDQGAFTATGASAARSLAARFGDRLTPEDFGAVGDGVTNDATALQAWLTAIAAGVPGALNDSTYICNSLLTVATDGSTASIDVICAEGAVLDFSGASVGACITVGDHTAGVTEMTATYPLAADIDNLALSITLDDNAGEPPITDGDLLYVIDTDDYSLTGDVTVDGSETYYRQGCVVPAVSSSAGVITLRRRIRGGPYQQANTDVKIYKTTKRSFRWVGGEIICPDGQSNGFVVYDAFRGLIADTKVTNSGFTAIGLARCYDFEVRSPRIYSDQTGSTTHYGVWIVGGFNVWVTGAAAIEVDRHCVVTTAGDRPGYVVNRNCGVRGGTYISRASSALDMHGPSEDCWWIAPYTEGYVMLGGNGATLWGGEIHSLLVGSDKGVCVRLRDRWGSNHSVGGGVHLHSDAALDSADAILEMDSLGILGGGTVRLDGIVLHQNVDYSGTRQCVRVALAAGSDSEVSFIARNISRMVADGVTDTSMRFAINGQTDARYKSIATDGLENIALLHTNVRGPQTIHRNGYINGSTGTGIDVRHVTDTAVQEIILENWRVLQSEQSGIRIGGGAEADPTHVRIINCVSGENAQSGSGTDQDRGALEISECDTAVVEGGEYGDIQSTQTQTRRIVATNVGTLHLAPSAKARGAVRLPDVLSGVNAVKGCAPALLASSHVKSSHTGDTNETALATITVPANAMGANGFIVVDALFSGTNSANDKIYRLRWGGISGTELTVNTATTAFNVRFHRIIANRNDAASQIVMYASVNSFGASGNALVTATEDTAAGDVTLVLTGQLENSGEEVAVESYSVNICHVP
jgi:hypothetical protein